MKRSSLKPPTLAQVRKWQNRPKTAIKRKTPVKRVSVKHRSKLNLYYKARKKFLAENPVCEVFPHLLASQIHHKKRRGPFLLDESTWMAVSHDGHLLIHAEPGIARERGWLV